MRRGVFSIRACAAIAALAAMSSGGLRGGAGDQRRSRGHGPKGRRGHQVGRSRQGLCRDQRPIRPFVEREPYITVTGPDGTMLANGANKSLIGLNRINTKDAKGKPFINERMELAKDNPSFWQSNKYLNPVSKKVEPKQMYCERLDATAVCGGIYQ